MRVSRCWRSLKMRKWRGEWGNEGDNNSSDSALFCAACPQPGVNMPPNWELDPRKYVIVIPREVRSTEQIIRWLFRRSFDVDGFFSADHLKSASRNAAIDVSLTETEYYVTDQEKYKNHLSTAQEYQEVC